MWRRSFQITVVVLSCLASLLFSVLWVASYWRLDSAVCHWIPHKFIMGLSLCGELGFVYGNGAGKNRAPLAGPLDWKRSPNNPYRRIGNGNYPRYTNRYPPFPARFRWHRWGADRYVGAPYWFLVATSASIGIIARFGAPRRFTLRTLLLMTALIAVFLTAVLRTGVRITSF